MKGATAVRARFLIVVALSLACLHVQTVAEEPSPLSVGTPPFGEMQQLDGHRGAVASVAISADGNRALTAGDGTLRLWDVASGEELTRIDVGPRSPTCAALSPDGRYVAYSAGEPIVRVWDLETGKLWRAFEQHKGNVTSVVFSADGQRLLSGSADATLWLCDLKTEKELRRFEGHKGEVAAVALSSDGRLALSGSTDKTVRHWDVETGRELRRFEGHEDEVRAVAFSADGKQALSGGRDRTLRLWEVQTGKQLHIFQGRELRVNGPERILATVTQVSVVRGAAFTPDGKRAVAASDDGLVRQFDIETGMEVGRYRGHTGPASSIGVARGQSIAISGGVDGTARIWDLQAGQEVRRFKLEARVFGVAVSPDGKRALSGTCEDRTMRLWDLENGKMLREYKSNRLSWVYAVAFSPDGKQALCTGNEFFVWLWDLDSGKVLGQHNKHALKIESLAFSSDGRQTVSASPDQVAIWDLQKMVARTMQWEDLEGQPRAAALLPDNRGVLIAGEGLGLWDSKTGKRIRPFESAPEGGFRKHYLQCLAVSPDGRYVLGGASVFPNSNSLWLWDVATGRQIRKFRGHPGEIHSVAFAPDCKTAASAGTDNTVRLWDVATGTELWCFEGHTAAVWSIAFSPDGRTLLSGAWDNTMRLWALPK